MVMDGYVAGRTWYSRETISLSPSFFTLEVDQFTDGSGSTATQRLPAGAVTGWK